MLGISHNPNEVIEWIWVTIAYLIVVLVVVIGIAIAVRALQGANERSRRKDARRQSHDEPSWRGQHDAGGRNRHA